MEVDYNWYTIHGSPKRGYNRNGNYPIEEVYQGRRVKLESSETIVARMILSDKVKLYEIVGPHVKSCMWILKHSIHK
jgi:hypothetical protein